MNIKEIYVLNRALDGEDIFSLPKFSDMKISDFLADAIKDGLIEKGILEQYDSFTYEGIRIVSRLKSFKEAKKHIQVDNVSIGIIDEQQSILIIHNPLDEDYKIISADTTDITSQLIESYTFLSSGEDVADEEDEVISRIQFDQEFVIDSNSSFRFLLDYEDETCNEMFFFNNGKIKIYDYDSCILSTKTPTEVLEQLQERMSAL